jgi:hypothetical protein
VSLARPASPPPHSPQVGVDLAAACGEWSAALRRADRYGALGFTAARLALVDAGLEPPPGNDSGWGVMIGSSLGCWGSNAEHLRALRAPSGADLSPARFVRTVSSAVNGDISIAWHLGGPSATFVSGWTAGAEALIGAAVAIAGGRAHRMLAAGIESPEGPFLRMPAMAAPGGEQLNGTVLAEGAAVALLAAQGPPGALRLRACARGTGASPVGSIAGLRRVLEPLRVRALVLANTLPPSMRARIDAESGPDDLRVIDLPARSGEIGAAGAVAAAALAPTFLPAASRDVVVVISRGFEGGVVVLVLGR